MSKSTDTSLATQQKTPEPTKGSHTPTPYEVQEFGYNRRVVGGIYRDEEHRIVTEVCTVSGNRTSQDVTQATAEFIRDACNAHDDLLAACKAWVDYFDELTRYDEPGDKLAEVRNHYHRDRVEATRAAVAKAEGGAKVVPTSAAPLPADFVDNDPDGMA